METTNADEEKFGELREFDVRVECGVCGKMVAATHTKLMKFSMCGCSNKARICRENVAVDSHLLGGEDDEQTFVHVYVDGKPALPRLPLKRWNQLQNRFKTTGSLIESDPIPSSFPMA